MVNKRVLFGKFEYLPKMKNHLLKLMKVKRSQKCPNKIKAFVLLNLFKNGCSTIFQLIKDKI